MITITEFPLAIESGTKLLLGIVKLCYGNYEFIIYHLIVFLFIDRANNDDDDGFNLISARHFITRALLSADTFEKAQKILRDSGVGAADGCSINMTFLK